MLLRSGGGVLVARTGQAALNALTGWLVASRIGAEHQGVYALSIFLAMAGAAVLNGGVGLAAVPPIRSGVVTPRAMLRAQGLWTAAGLGALAVLVAVAWRAGLGALAATRLGWMPGDAAVVLAAVGALIIFEVVVYDLNALGRVVAGPAVNLGRAALLLLCVLAGLALDALDWRWALWSYAATQMIAALSVALLVRRADHAAAGAGPGPGAWRLALRTVSAGWTGQLSSVVSLLHMRLDLLLVAAWHGPAVVGIYSVAVLVGEMLWLISGALQPVLVYTASAVDDPEIRDRTTARAVRLGLAASVAAGAVLWFAAPPLLGLLFGDDYAGSVPALRALLPGVAVFSVGAVLAGDFIGRGRPAWNTRASLLTLIVNLACGVILIPSHGAVGAAWASSAAYLASALDMLRRFRNVSGLGWTAILAPRAADFSRD